MNSEAIVHVSDSGHVRILEKLLERKPTGKKMGHALRYGSINGHAEVAKLLLERCEIPKRDGDLAIVNASQRGHCDTLRILLKDPRFTPVTQESAALRLTARQGHVGTLKLLLDDGRSNPAALGNEAIQAAQENSHEEVVHLLLMDKRVNTSLVPGIFLVCFKNFMTAMVSSDDGADEKDNVSEPASTRIASMDTHARRC